MPAYTSPTGYSYPQYENLRQVLAPDYATLPPAEIEALMDSMFGPGTAEQYDEYLEGIFGDIGKAFSSAARDVGRFAAKAAPAVATVGGGALQGALAGAPLGLPGIIAGAAAGGTGAALSKYGKGTARDIGGALSGVTGLAGQFSPTGQLGGAIGPAISGLAGGGGKPILGGLLSPTAISAIAGIGGKGGAGAPMSALGGLLGGGKGGAAVSALGGLLGGGAGGTGTALGALTSLFGSGNAIGQLLSLLQRPEAMQALAALNLGPAGRPTIPVGSAQTPVPVSAITNVIRELADQAAAEAAGLSDGAESEPRYMTDETGEFVGDPALDRDRAARVWDLLNVAQAERLMNAVAVHQQVAEAYYDEAYGEDLAEDYSEDYGEDLIEAYRDDLGEELIEAYGEWDENEPEWDESEPYEYA